MRRSTAVLIAATTLVSGAFWLSRSSVDLDRSIPVRAGGELTIGMTLGSGFSFDKGSLTISSHPRDEVRVIVDSSGWGEYAVRVDVREVPSGVRVDSRVEGLLHWLFGGPTVDVQVFVPPDYSIDASIEDGPLLIEDVTGAIVAKIGDSDLTLRRVEGDVSLTAGGPILVEDIEGDLALKAQDSAVKVSGMRGNLRLRSNRGAVELSSVTGRFDVASSRGAIRAEDIRGNGRIVSENGGIYIDRMEGDLEVETDRGRIEVEELEGRILAKSSRGGIEVRFSADPSGVIETQRGTIEVEVPQDSRFDLNAYTGRGRVEIDSDLEFTHAPSVETSRARVDAEAFRDVGRQVAAELTARVYENVQRGLETGDWDLDWNFQFDFDRRLGEARARRSPQPKTEEKAREERWQHGGWGWKDWQAGDNYEHGRREVHINGRVNGGGMPLRLYTGRGSIEVDDD